MTETYGIYSVDEYPEQNDGKWGGYKVATIESGLTQGKLYPKSDGRENYQAKETTTTTSDDLEI